MIPMPSGRRRRSRERVGRSGPAGSPFRFVAPDKVGDQPNVVADGAPRHGTVATVSHWPATPTPLAWRADLSTESALLALAAPQALPSGAEVVTVDHADEDAVLSAAVLCLDGFAARHGALLVEAARVGDFAVVRDRQAALVSFALAALVDPARTPVPAVRCGHARGMAATGLMVEHALGLLPQLVEDPGRFVALWQAEAAAYDAAVSALSAGSVLVEEDHARDLAVVRPAQGRWPPGTRWGTEPVHPAAVHGVSNCMRVATLSEGDCRVRFRYETWVRLAVPRLPLRVDLGSAVEELDRLESGAPAGCVPEKAVHERGGGPMGSAREGAAWCFDGAGAIRPSLHRVADAPTSIDPGAFLAVVRGVLDQESIKPPAWDPYRPGRR